MDDERVWRFEEDLWRASDERYHERIDEDCVMALSETPHIFSGDAAIEAVGGTPPWDKVSFSQQVVTRPNEGLIVVGYRVDASEGETHFAAACTSVYCRRAHDDWSVVQHSQIALNPNHGEQ